MRILRVIDTLDPRTGGPAAGLRALTPVLAAMGHETVIVTVDRPGANGAAFPHAEVHALGPAHGSHRWAPALRPWLRRHLPAFDVVVVHGLWQSLGRTVRAVARETGVPYFIYPHGMLDPWFRGAYPLKHFKKWLYWRLVEGRVLRDATAVLYTCEEERRLARESFSPYACTERVVNYGTAGPPPESARQIAAWSQRQPELDGRPFLLFLGRIHRKKGLDLLQAAYLTLAARCSHPPALVVAGPESDPELRQQLQARAAALPASARIIWTGMLEGDAKWGALRRAEALVLPSHQENFGLAVVEALAVGVPVLISRQVNIWREIVADGAGLAAADTAEGVDALLAAWAGLPGDERAAMGRAAAASYARRFSIDAVARSFVEVVTPFVAARPAASARSGAFRPPTALAPSP